MCITIITTLINSRQIMCCIHSLKPINDLFFNHPLHKLVVISLIIIAHMRQIQICRKNTHTHNMVSYNQSILGIKWSHGEVTDMTNHKLECTSAVILILSHSLRDETSTSMK